MMRVIGGLAPALLLGLIVACTGDAPTLLDPPSEATWEAPATSEPTQTVVAPVTLEPGDDIQAIVDRNRAGTRYVLAPGVYREQAVVPKSGDIFEGEPGAVLSGARILEGFSVADNLWSIGGQTQQGVPHGGCGSPQEFADLEDYTGCQFAEHLFVDDQPLWQVTAIADLAPGRWFFDYGADLIYLADDPAGRIIEASVTPAAFDGSASKVTIRGLVIEKYSNLAQSGAIHGDRTRSWTVEQNEIRLNHGFGLRTGSEMRVLNNYIHSNGQIGVGGLGSHVLVQGNEIAYNNTAGFLEEWEAGGTKFVLSDGLVFRDNWVHHNIGRGVWTDIDVINALITDNLVEWNTRGGIVHEMSFAARIVDNTSRYNGLGLDVWVWGAQVLVQNSSGVEVSGNLVTVSAFGGNGIAIVNQRRGSGIRGRYVSERVSVTNNTIRHLGVAGSNGAPNGCASSENLFDGNTYEALGAWFKLANFESCGLLTWDEFQELGHEPAGTAVELG